jgi:hypothetical protein
LALPLCQLTSSPPPPPDLLCQDLEAPEHSFTCKPSDEGLEVLRLLQNAVFGEAGAQGSLAQCAYLATLAQVGALRRRAGGDANGWQTLPLHASTSQALDRSLKC